MELDTLNNVFIGNQLTTNFAAEWSKNGKIFIITDANVTILQLSPVMTNTENTLTFAKSEINVGEYFIGNHTGVNMENTLLHLPKSDFYHSILNYNLTPNISNANAVTPRPISAAWSPLPEEVNHKIEPLIAVLSNTGNVEIFTQKRIKWNLAVNITECLVEYMKSTVWNDQCDGNNYEEQYEIHKKRVHQTSATAVVWSKIFNGPNNSYYCYLTVGHENGSITVWKIACVETNDDQVMKPILVTVRKTGLDYISTLHWCSTSEDTALDYIIIGDINGLVKCVPLINNATIELTNEEIDIWKHKDIRVSYIVSFAYDDSICLVILKGTYVVLALISNSKVVECVKFLNMGNLNISGIQLMKPSYYMLTTTTGTIKVLKIIKAKNDLEYKVFPVSVDIKWDFHACHGLIRSPDNIMWGILMHPCKIIDHLILRSAVQIVFCISTKFDPGKYLKNNSTCRLYNSWESIEILRCLSARNNSLPCSWLAEIDNYDELSLYELRIFMWISLICQTFIQKKIKCRKLKNTLVNSDAIRKLLGYKYRIGRINVLLDLYDSQKRLTPFQTSSLQLLYDDVTSCQNEKWFEELTGETSRDTLKVIIKRYQTLTKFEVPICRWCGDNLTSKPCKSNHPDHRCCITGVQISGIPKWECSICGLPAADEIEDDELFCPYCDIPMVQNLDFITLS